LLRQHARASNSFAAWYFLALHLPEGRSVLRLPVGTAKEALDAARQAMAFGDSALCTLLATMLEVGADNFGLHHLEMGLRRFGELLSTDAEAGPEYLRAYWCLEASWSVLHNHQRAVRDVIRQRNEGGENGGSQRRPKVF
jgi:hypothetical protein